MSVTELCTGERTEIPPSPRVHACDARSVIATRQAFFIYPSHPRVACSFRHEAQLAGSVLMISLSDP